MTNRFWIFWGILLLSYYTNAQVSTTYLNASFDECSKAKAIYIMNTETKGDTLVKQVFVKNKDILVLLVKSPVNDPTRIYQKTNYDDGTPKDEGVFINGKKSGTWKYYSDWQRISFLKSFKDDVLDGPFAKFYINGNKAFETNYVNGDQVGQFTYYHMNGNLQSTGYKKNNILDGIYKKYDINGKLESVCQYVIGAKEGLDSIFVDGKFSQTVLYKSGKEVKDTTSTVDKPSTADPFVSVEKMPMFPGGESEMMKFIATRMVYPDLARNANIEGRVMVKFVVASNGKVKDFEIVSEPLGYGLDKAAVDVVKAMPDWEPGSQNGIPVPVYFNIPIRFRLY
jgi:TonB family protein